MSNFVCVFLFDLFFSIICFLSCKAINSFVLKSAKADFSLLMFLLVVVLLVLLVVVVVGCNIMSQNYYIK